MQGRVKALLQAADFSGDGMNKSGNFNFLLLCNGIKTAMMDCAHGTREENWTEADVLKRMSASVDHYAGKSLVHFALRLMKLRKTRPLF